MKMVHRKRLSDVLVATLFISLLLFGFESGNSGVVHANDDFAVPNDFSQKIDAQLYETLSTRAQNDGSVRVIVKLNV